MVGVTPAGSTPARLTRLLWGDFEIREVSALARVAAGDANLPARAIVQFLDDGREAGDSNEKADG
jgi:hypothetical protein